MKKKIMVIGLSVLTTMTGLKSQWGNELSFTTVATYPCEDEHYYNDTIVKRSGKFWERNQELVIGIASLMVVPIVAKIMWSLEDKDNSTIGSGGTSGGSSGCRLANAVQCSGIAKSTGQQCQNRTTDCSGRCHHHK